MQSNNSAFITGKIGGAAASQVRNVGQNIAEKGEEIAKTQAYKRVSDTATAVKEEFEQSAFSGQWEAFFIFFD